MPLFSSSCELVNLMSFRTAKLVSLLVMVGGGEWLLWVFTAIKSPS